MVIVMKQKVMASVRRQKRALAHQVVLGENLQRGGDGQTRLVFGKGKDKEA
jgi:hypothetical protein